MGSIPGSGRSPGGGHGNPLQYSCLENPVDRGAWWAMVHALSLEGKGEGADHLRNPAPGPEQAGRTQLGCTGLTFPFSLSSPF